MKLTMKPPADYNEIHEFTLHMSGESLNWEDVLDEARYEDVMWYLHNGDKVNKLKSWLQSLPEDAKRELKEYLK